MNSPSESHEPTPEFRAHLEWQIQSALRRETRFAAAVGRPAARLRTAVVVLVALVVGGISGVASGEFQDARRKDLLIESTKSEEALVRLRIDLARAGYDEARSRFEIGMAGRETVQAAENELRDMETALARLRLDFDEIQISSAAPRNDLQAPLIGKRDFVRERLQLELAQAQRGLAAAEQGLSQVQSRFSVGTAPRAAVLQAETELSQTRAQMEQLRSTVDLRQRFLKGEIKAEELSSAFRRVELRLQGERLDREVTIARGRVDEVRSLVEIGRATPLELKRAEVELLEREFELKRVRRELEMIAGGRK